MILMSKYKGQHGGKEGKKIRAGVSPPFRAMPERKHFLYRRCSLRGTMEHFFESVFLKLDFNSNNNFTIMII